MTPSSATVTVGKTQQFTATVTGTSNTAVTWSVSGGSGNGTISTTGLYTAPATVPTPAVITITATSQADYTKSGTATVTITSGGSATVTVSPNPTSVEVFQTQQFTATVNGQASSGVRWQVNGITGGSTTTGTISSSGLYHAPNSVPTTSTSSGGSVTTTVTVTAVSQANASSSGSATVTVFAPNQNAQLIPVKLGTTGGNANDSSRNGNTITCCGGTLGSLVMRGNAQYILSNTHVFDPTDNLTALGQAIIQPGLIDANCSSTGTITVGHLSQFVSLESNNNRPAADAAIAQVVFGTVDAQGTILELGGMTSGGMPTDGPPHAGFGSTVVAGRTVAKSGRSTGLTCSSIFSTMTNTSVTYQKGCGTGTAFTATYTGQVAVTGGSFSAEGDSGSLIVTQDTADPVALLFAGSDMETVGNPVSDVLTALADPNTGAKPVFVGDPTPNGHTVAACSLPRPQAAMAQRLAVQKVAPSSAAITRATYVRDAHAPELMAHPEVQAVGVGGSYDNPAEPAILFFVTKGQPRTNIPAQVDGVRTRIIEGDLFSLRGALSAEESATLEQSAAPPQVVYSISDAEVARAKLVHAAHADEWMKKSGVQGIGIGSSVDAPGEAALIIFLIRGIPHDPVPRVIDGLRTRIRESSRFRAGFGEAPPQRGCSLPSAKDANTKTTR